MTGLENGLPGSIVGGEVRAKSFSSWLCLRQQKAGNRQAAPRWRIYKCLGLGNLMEYYGYIYHCHRPAVHLVLMTSLRMLSHGIIREAFFCFSQILHILGTKIKVLLYLPSLPTPFNHIFSLLGDINNRKLLPQFPNFMELRALHLVLVLLKKCVPSC